MFSFGRHPRLLVRIRYSIVLLKLRLLVVVMRAGITSPLKSISGTILMLTKSGTEASWRQMNDTLVSDLTGFLSTFAQLAMICFLREPEKPEKRTIQYNHRHQTNLVLAHYRTCWCFQRLLDPLHNGYE